MSVNIRQFIVRPAVKSDLQQLANLVHFGVHVHRHLDWRPPLDWVGHDPYLVAEKKTQIYAALACPPDPPGVSWIRLFAASSDIGMDAAWEELWQAAHEALGPRTTVAAIPLHSWFRSLLEDSGFVHTHNVVVLSWKRSPILPPAIDRRYLIRAMTEADLPQVEVVDTSAFGIIWQNSLENLAIAFQHAAIATVAVQGDDLIGYQISTATPAGGHLARLAVKPKNQGIGVGYAILYDLLSHYERRGAHNVTVNTQHDNLASLSLYQKAGFKRTGEEYPVYQFTT